MPDSEKAGKPDAGSREPPAIESSGRMDLLPKSRLEAFADGVFAIAITLLVLEIEAPVGTGSLWRGLAEEWPSFLGYLVSFVFIGGLWMSHVSVTRLVKRGDSTFYGLNLLVLLFVAILPFSTKLMATHLGDEWEQGAVVLFGANLVLASIMINATIAYAMRDKDLRDDTVAEQELRSFLRSRLWNTLILVVAAALAIVVPLVAVLVYLGASVAFLVQPMLSAWRQRRRARARARIVESGDR
jgi:uncharacterized membrane protein